MGPGANFFLRKRQTPSWFDALPAKVAFALLLLVFLAVPAFLLMVHNRALVLYYLVYPITASLGLYLLSVGRQYLGSIIFVLSVYGVITWMFYLVGFTPVVHLKWWIIALLPWVMFTDQQRIALWLLSALPVAFSFAVPYLPPLESPLLPAEQEFIRQILRVSVALGAFICIYFLRQHYVESEKLRGQENEFYSNTLNAIPLPIIIKDGITLDYVFFNQAAQLTYDLNPRMKNSNSTTFSESCAVTVSRLDQEVLRSVTYHIEPDENLVHQTGIHWHFRTYRIPLELASSGRRLLVTVSEDLRALNLVMRKAQENKEMIGQVFQLLAPLFIHFAAGIEKVTIANPSEWLKPWQGLELEIISYLEYHLPRHPVSPGQAAAPHRFPLAGRMFELYCGKLPQSGDIFGLVIPVRDNS